MNQSEFTNLIKQAGRTVTLTRGTGFINPTMASAVADPEDPILKDATQDDITVRFTQDDFKTGSITKPDRYDRITDADGRNYAIQQVMPLWGLGGQVWGYKALIRGNE